jgi:hypothetical protein
MQAEREAAEKELETIFAEDSDEQRTFLDERQAISRSRGFSVDAPPRAPQGPNGRERKA